MHHVDCGAQKVHSLKSRLWSGVWCVCVCARAHVRAGTQRIACGAWRVDCESSIGV